MIHDINFNKIAFIDWSKMFIMQKYVFYNLNATIMSNMIKEKNFKNLAVDNRPNDL